MTVPFRPSVPVPAPAAAPPRRRRAWRWLAGTVGALLLLAIGLLGTVWWAAHSADATAWLLAESPV